MTKNNLIKSRGYHKKSMKTVTTGTHTDILVNPKKVRYNIGFKKEMFEERSNKNIE